MKEDMNVKNALMTLYQMGNDAEDCILSLQTSLLYNTSTLLNDCRAKVEYIKKTEPQLSQIITKLAMDDLHLKPYLTVPVYILRIAENIERIVELIDKKVREEILFSERAMDEITFLFQRLIEILNTTAEIILARNTILSKYVEESVRGVIRRAIEYATLHEERLIEGSCLPIASAIYIYMLDIIKSIAWHAKEIALKLAV